MAGFAERRGVVTYQNDFEEHLLVHLHELLVPLIDLGCLLSVVVVLVVGGRGVLTVVLAPLDHLAQNGLGHLIMDTLLSNV